MNRNSIFAVYKSALLWPPDEGLGGGYRLLWRRHPLLLWGKTPAGDSLPDSAVVYRQPPGGDHRGVQPRQRGLALHGPSAPQRGQPHLPGGAVRGPPAASVPPPHPLPQAGGPGGGGHPAGQNQQPKPGPDLRSARSDHGLLGGHAAQGHEPVP